MKRHCIKLFYYVEVLYEAGFLCGSSLKLVCGAPSNAVLMSARTLDEAILLSRAVFEAILMSGGIVCVCVCVPVVIAVTAASYLPCCRGGHKLHVMLVSVSLIFTHAALSSSSHLRPVSSKQRTRPDEFLFPDEAGGSDA